MGAPADENFSQLSERFRPALMAFFGRRVRNHAEAEDMTQEVFARLTAMPDVSAAPTDAYIFQIARNLLRDRSRREKIRADYRFGLMTDEGVGVEPLDPERVLASREALGQLAGVLNELPDRTRAIFILYRLESMKKRDIADSYGISVSAVDKHLMKAMALMMKRLEQMS